MRKQLVGLILTGIRGVSSVLKLAGKRFGWGEGWVMSCSGGWKSRRGIVAGICPMCVEGVLFGRKRRRLGGWDFVRKRTARQLLRLPVCLCPQGSGRGNHVLEGGKRAGVNPSNIKLPQSVGVGMK